MNHKNQHNTSSTYRTCMSQHTVQNDQSLSSLTVESYQLQFFKPSPLSTIGLSELLEVIDEALSVPQRHTETIGHIVQI